MSFTVRLGQHQELTLLQEIERSAGLAFNDLGMHEIANDDPPDLEELAQYQAAGHLWVAADSANQPHAYIMVKLIDAGVHIEQVSVASSHAGQGLGRKLIEHIGVWAKQQGINAVTLTTFTDVPWNAPYYQRLGFENIEQGSTTADLQNIRKQEAALGLDRWPRVCMVKQL